MRKIVKRVISLSHSSCFVFVIRIYICVCAGFENQRRQGDEKKFEDALGEKSEERERLRQKIEDMERYL